MSKYWKVFIVIFVSLIVLGAGISSWIRSTEELTDTEDIFDVSLQGPPTIDMNTWELTITGFLEEPRILTYDEVKSFPNITVEATLKCVEGPYAKAEWTGVSLSFIMDLVGLKPEAKEVVCFGRDGYSSSLTLDEAREDDVILAYMVNNEDLPKENGYPLALIVPGKYGYKWVKWIDEIQVVNYDYKGYWERRGWSDEANISTFAEWWPHAIFLSVAAIFGAMSTISGLKFSKQSRFWQDLLASRKFHDLSYFMYYVILFPVFIYWTFSIYNMRGDLFYSGHGITALTVIILHAVGGISGKVLINNKNHSGARHIHLIANLLAYMLLIGTIINGIYLVRGTT